VVDRVLPLEEARAAQRLLTDRILFGKVVLTVGDPEIARRPAAARANRQPTDHEGTS
jgi:hypothetical protein